MSRPPEDRRSRKRGLTAEDAAVWEHVAKGVERRKPARKGRYTADQAAPGEDRDLQSEFERQLTETTASPEDRALGRLALGSRKHSQPPTPRVEPAAERKRADVASQKRKAPQPISPALGGLDAKLSRKIRQGRVEIDDRLDLHGMTQATAHAALRRFILYCAAQNKRTVLVITGKGRSSPRSDHGDDWIDSSARSTGVLRRNLPGWLSDPALKPLIIGFESAAVQHGGAGAYYVRLRRGN